MHRTREHAPAIHDSGISLLPLVRVKYFPVWGTSLKGVVRTMIKNGPTDSSHEHRFAHVKWKVSWNWNRGRDHLPIFEELRLTCKITLIFPLLIKEELLTKEERGMWNRISLALAKHEKNHILHVLENYRDVKKRILSAWKANRQLSGAEANTIGQSVVSKIQKLDESYDKETNHGMNEGLGAIIQKIPHPS
ncbi:MAG: DUF922 domain-containing protein [Bdellovibrionales bacterium]|nr:DUF922 domain-containing protein [Bdellovibrionales bacterium]